VSGIKTLLVSTGSAVLLGAVAADIVPTTMKPAPEPEWRRNLESIQLHAAAGAGQRDFLLADGPPIDPRLGMAEAEPPLFAYYASAGPAPDPIPEISYEPVEPAGYEIDERLPAEPVAAEPDSNDLLAATSSVPARPNGRRASVRVMNPPRLGDSSVVVERGTLSGSDSPAPRVTVSRAPPATEAEADMTAGSERSAALQGHRVDLSRRSYQAGISDPDINHPTPWASTPVAPAP
jgi:hypothetical protein